jgi:arsenate reductase
MITIYQKPTCSTCRNVLKLIKANEAAFTAVNYYEQPFTKAHLKQLLKKGGLAARDILRTKEDIYKELGLAKASLSDDALLELMIKHPDLIQRPLVETADTVILARPAETVKQLF